MGHLQKSCKDRLKEEHTGACPLVVLPPYKVWAGLLESCGTALCQHQTTKREWSHLRPSVRQSPDDCSHGHDPQQDPQLSPPQFLTPRIVSKYNGCCFKPLSFEVVCYTAKANWYELVQWIVTLMHDYYSVICDPRWNMTLRGLDNWWHLPVGRLLFFSNLIYKL